MSILGEISDAYRRLGDRSQTLSLLKDIEILSKTQRSIESHPYKRARVARKIGMVYAELGDRKAATDWAKECYGEDRASILSMILRVHSELMYPEFKELRSEFKFNELRVEKEE